MFDETHAAAGGDKRRAEQVICATRRVVEPVWALTLPLVEHFRSDMPLCHRQRLRALPHCGDSELTQVVAKHSCRVFGTDEAALLQLGNQTVGDLGDVAAV